MFCVARASRRPEEDKRIDGARLPQSRRCRKSAGLPRRPAGQLATLSISSKDQDPMSHHYSGPDFGFPRGDARLDFSDLYAFPKPGDSSKSIPVMNVHPSAVVNPPGPTIAEPFA